MAMPELQRVQPSISQSKDSTLELFSFQSKSYHKIIDWSFQSLPDEILVGLDIDTSKSLDGGLVSKYTGSMFEP